MRHYFTPLRLSAYLMVIFCVGHTLGALVSTPHFSDASDQVVASMKAVSFSTQGFDRVWWDFYLGFGYLISIFFLFSAALAWFIAGLDPAMQRRCAFVSWALFATLAGNTLLAIRFLFALPIVFSSVITALLLLHCLRLTRTTTTPGATS